MKTLGLIGGTGWHSTADYYLTINRLINERAGGLHSAKLFLYSVNFEEFKRLGDENNWEKIAELLSDAAQKLEHAGAECLVICANTLHVVADQIQDAIKIPILHIADATGRELVKQNIKTAGLLGTKTTMERDFFKTVLHTYGINVVIPDPADREFIHHTIFAELGKDIFTPETKKRYLEIIGRLQQNGGEGIVFGCTEIPLLIKPEDCAAATFDTMQIHAQCAADFALSE